MNYTCIYTHIAKDKKRWLFSKMYNHEHFIAVHVQYKVACSKEEKNNQKMNDFVMHPLIIYLILRYTQAHALLIGSS